MVQLQEKREKPGKLHVMKSVFYQQEQAKSQQPPQHLQALSLNKEKLQKRHDYSQVASQFCKNVIVSNYQDHAEQLELVKCLEEEKLRQKKKLYKEAVQKRGEQMRKNMLLKKSLQSQEKQSEAVENLLDFEQLQKESGERRHLIKQTERPKNYLQEMRTERKKRQNSGEH